MGDPIFHSFFPFISTVPLHHIRLKKHRPWLCRQKITEKPHPYRSGRPLTLCKQGNRLLLLSANRPVAALSKAASTHWADKTKNIISIQVVAMIRRSAGDGDPAYKSRYHTNQWEVPLVKIAHRL
jgi:hypothetical protein